MKDVVLLESTMELTSKIKAVPKKVLSFPLIIFKMVQDTTSITSARSLEGFQCHNNAVFDLAWMPGHMNFVTVSGKQLFRCAFSLFCNILFAERRIIGSPHCNGCMKLAQDCSGIRWERPISSSDAGHA